MFQLRYLFLIAAVTSLVATLAGSALPVWVSAVFFVGYLICVLPLLIFGYLLFVASRSLDEGDEHE